MSRIADTHLNNQMIHHLAKQTFQTIPTNREQVNEKRDEKITCSLLIPTLTSVFLQKYSEIPYIYTHTPGQV